jgi:DNA polymerase-3 subunit alpha/DNA polymerase-3 subunit epsilon
MILFLDTETTGINKAIDRVVQIAWIVADYDGSIITKKSFIIKPDGFYIPRQSTAIHGITNEIAQKSGKSLENVFEQLTEDAEDAEMLVAHNASFDIGFLKGEFANLDIEYPFNSLKTICTMMVSTNYCRFQKTNGMSGYKRPKLEELHFFLFKEYFNNAHDALADTEACMRCFYELADRGIIDLSFKDSEVSKNEFHHYNRSEKILESTQSSEIFNNSPRQSFFQQTADNNFFIALNDINPSKVIETWTEYLGDELHYFPEFASVNGNEELYKNYLNKTSILGNSKLDKAFVEKFDYLNKKFTAIRSNLSFYCWLKYFFRFNDSPKKFASYAFVKSKCRLEALEAMILFIIEGLEDDALKIAKVFIPNAEAELDVIKIDVANNEPSYFDKTRLMYDILIFSTYLFIKQNDLNSTKPPEYFIKYARALFLETKSFCESLKRACGPSSQITKLLEMTEVFIRNPDSVNSEEFLDQLNQMLERDVEFYEI